MSTPHANLSPSGAYRWLACPGSVRLNREIARTTNIYANEGTAAHALASRCLMRGLAPERFAGMWITTDGALSASRLASVPMDECFRIDAAMVSGVRLYMDAIDQYADAMPGCSRHYEERVILNEHVWGTADCVLVQDSERVVCIDLKYGKGYVEAEENPQLIIYLFAAVQTLSGHPPKTAAAVIVQPRANGVSKVRAVEYTYTDLESAWWQRIVDGTLATRADDAPLVAGSHCKYCPAAEAFVCPVLLAAAAEVAS